MSIKEFLENAPRAVAVFSFVILLITIIHEYGYFSVVGAHLQTVATTYDYFTNALLWLPATVGVITYINIVEQSIPAPNGPQRLGRGIYYQMGFWVLLAIVVFFSGGYFEFLIAMTIAYGFVLFLHAVVPKGPFLQRWILYKTIILTPIFLFGAYGYGAAAGHRDVRKRTDVYSVSFKDATVNDQNIILLRSFEKGILARNPVRQRIEFIRWDGIRTLSKFATSELEVSYGCYWFDLFCGDKLAVSP